MIGGRTLGTGILRAGQVYGYADTLARSKSVPKRWFDCLTPTPASCNGASVDGKSGDSSLGSGPIGFPAVCLSDRSRDFPFPLC